MCGWILLAASVLAFSAEKPAFEVASIKPNASEGKPGILKPLPDGVTIESVDIRSLISWAWHLPMYQVPSPPWLKPARYDIVARAAAQSPVDQLRLMMQTLLEERFHLAVHIEKKDIPVYALVAAKGGMKQLHDPEPGHAPGMELGSTDSSGGKHWVFHNLPLSALGGLYSNAALGRPILDMTEIKGGFDFTFVEPPRIPADTPMVDYILGDVFPEIQRQLGIRVEAKTAPTDVLIIDRVDARPTEN